MPAFGIRASNSRNSLHIIATSTKLLTDTLNPVQPKHAVGLCVSFVILIAECRKVSLEYFAKLVLATRDVLRFLRLKVR